MEMIKYDSWTILFVSKTVVCSDWSLLSFLQTYCNPLLCLWQIVEEKVSWGERDKYLSFHSKRYIDHTLVPASWPIQSNHPHLFSLVASGGDECILRSRPTTLKKIPYCGFHIKRLLRTKFRGSKLCSTWIKMFVLSINSSLWKKRATRFLWSVEKVNVREEMFHRLFLFLSVFALTKAQKHQVTK